MPSPTPLAIHGARGRMGQRLIALGQEDPALEVVCELDEGEHEIIGSPRVMIDFSAPPGTRWALDACRERGIALVIGTTGLTAADDKLIDQAADDIAVLQAPNMSLGVNLLFALAGQVSKMLGDDYDIEVVEAHHRFKKDAPSGTALGIARAICDATGKDMDAALKHGRSGESPRNRGEIGMHALRLGDEVGAHTVSFGGLGEQIALSHKATTRDVFAGGALTAAKWLADKPAARYAMSDVLGL